VVAPGGTVIRTERRLEGRRHGPSKAAGGKHARPKTLECPGDKTMRISHEAIYRAHLQSRGRCAARRHAFAPDVRYACHKRAAEEVANPLSFQRS
jgi:hypothetical protein